MRVLLGECPPRRLTNDLPGHEVETVPDAGWAGRNNGELLQLAASAFEGFPTVDISIEFQQNVSGLEDPRPHALTRHLSLSGD